MKSVIISIGNSDDKLSQKEWSVFVESINNHILLYCNKVHFFGGSPTWFRWQNVCWYADIHDDYINVLRESIIHTRKYFKQDSAAFILAETEFI